MWRVVTDTNRLNRAAGMDRIALTAVEGRGAARYLATTSMGAFDVEFEERPFEWKELERFDVLRVMRSGPLAELGMSFQFAPVPGGGSTVTLGIRVQARLGLLSPFIRMSALQSLSTLCRQIARMDAELVAASGPAKAPRPLEGALGRAAAKLSQATDPAVASCLATHVRDADDAELGRIRPYEIADRFGLERRDVLVGCLHAVGAGLLDLSWDIVCPSCRTASSHCSRLSELGDTGHCQLCDLSFGIDLDRAVEATFVPNRAVRAIEDGTYCIGGPARTPHVVSQVILPPSGEREVRAPDGAGRYKLFVRGGATALVEVAAHAPPRVVAEAAAALSPALIAVAPGGVIAVRNGLHEERHAKLERAEWPNLAATAHEVSALAIFRRLFSSDVLRPGMAMRVARVALFFSDLTGSTALYTRSGDAVAFRVVQDHFDVIGAVMEKHKGTIVKTIGDAVMASFVDEMQALDASADVLEGFERFRASRADCGDVFIKLGVHAGPSYVVTANGILDYFGQTVNVAARLQAKAESSELVVDESLFAAASGQPALARFELVERFETTLKGIDTPVRCARLRLATRTPAS
jgi:class 3 adenylate cyclase